MDSLTHNRAAGGSMERTPLPGMPAEARVPMQVSDRRQQSLCIKGSLIRLFPSLRTNDKPDTMNLAINELLGIDNSSLGNRIEIFRKYLPDPSKHILGESSTGDLSPAAE